MMRVHDLIGVGIGPFNLSLAALLEGVDGVDALFFDAKPAFTWHPGLLIEGTSIQVPFLADLVTLIDPTNRWSYLNYLRAHDRLYRFYFLERFHIPRREYDHYCRWVADGSPSCHFARRVDAIAWHGAEECFVVDVADVIAGRREQHAARNVVLGVGTVPHVPAHLHGILGGDVFHSADFLDQRNRCAAAGTVTIVGSGQSGAEVFLELLREQPAHGYRLRWLTRSPGFFPMEYSKLGLEHFTPDYTRYFHGLPDHVRDRIVPTQDLLYKGIGVETIAEIYDLLYERSVAGANVDACLLAHTEVECAERTSNGLRLRCRHREQDAVFILETDRLILATGYGARAPGCLAPLAALIVWDGAGRYRVGLDYRVEMSPSVTGSLFVQNGELHTHGVGAPDLGLGAHRAAVIINTVAGREVYRLPTRVAFTQFGTPCP
ncbi:MAG: SidA/IucD/PvdA family monooxygenase [Chloroflexi bacterium]|nr:SidA/IucD/PvdA family monooxygenase [Chloroflexota bacterium]